MTAVDRTPRAVVAGCSLRFLMGLQDSTAPASVGIWWKTPLSRVPFARLRFGGTLKHAVDGVDTI